MPFVSPGNEEGVVIANNQLVSSNCQQGKTYYFNCRTKTPTYFQMLPEPEKVLKTAVPLTQELANKTTFISSAKSFEFNGNSTDFKENFDNTMNIEKTISAYLDSK